MPDVLRIKVYDNGGRSFDQYTVVYIYGDGAYDMRGMSENPNHPQGFNQYAGEGHCFRYHRGLGKPVDWRNLNPQVKEAICNGAAWSL
jgi:hypothetical protein